MKTLIAFLISALPLLAQAGGGFYPPTTSSGGTVTTVSGTTNEIDVATGTTTPVISAAADILNDTIAACSDAGSTDTYACSTPVSIPYVTNGRYRFKANTANTGAATINFNSLGAKTIVKVAGGITTALADNDIRVGQVVDLVYDGTNMQMQSTLGNASGGVAPAGSPGDPQCYLTANSLINCSASISSTTNATHSFMGGVESIGITPPGTFTATATMDAGNPDGNQYAYALTCVYPWGETAIGTASNTIAAHNVQIAITDMPLCESGATSRNLFRSKGGDDTGRYYLISLNTTDTTYTDDAADSALHNNYSNWRGSTAAFWQSGLLFATEQRGLNIVAVGFQAASNLLLTKGTVPVQDHRASSSGSIFVGDSAGGALVFSDEDIMIGGAVADSGSGDTAGNVIIGGCWADCALNAPTTAAFNVGIGSGALNRVTAGHFNVALGYEAARWDTDQSNRLYIGPGVALTSDGSGSASANSQLVFGDFSLGQIVLGPGNDSLPAHTASVRNNIATTGATDFAVIAGAADAGTDKLFHGFLNDGTTETWYFTRDGNAAFAGLKTTGAATGKKIVCVDTATGLLYASSSGVACAN